MITVPNFPVIVPETPIIRRTMRKRQTQNGNRDANEYLVNGINVSVINLPFIPMAVEWVEIYVDGFRLINPVVLSATDNTPASYENYNISGETITFSSPLSGNIHIICDTSASHWSSAAIIQGDNVQSNTETRAFYNVPIFNWPVVSASLNGLM